VTSEVGNQIDHRFARWAFSTTPGARHQVWGLAARAFTLMDATLPLTIRRGGERDQTYAKSTDIAHLNSYRGQNHLGRHRPIEPRVSASAATALPEPAATSPTKMSSHRLKGAEAPLTMQASIQGDQRRAAEATTPGIRLSIC
jgi:hypothetical protein